MGNFLSEIIKEITQGIIAKKGLQHPKPYEVTHFILLEAQ